jgi:hypothetical protein
MADLNDCRRSVTNHSWLVDVVPGSHPIRLRIVFEDDIVAAFVYSRPQALRMAWMLFSRAFRPRR